MMSITAGSTNVSLYVYFVDDDGGTAPGEPTTGLLFSDIETGGSASYVRQGAARTDVTLVTLASASAAHADGGFILIDDTNMPGLYRVDIPDAAFAAGADFVIIQLVAAAANNTLMRPLLVMLPDVDFGDTVRAGLTALPNAAADAAGGLPISDAGGLDVDSIKTDTAAILSDTGTDGVVVAAASKTGYALSATGLDAIASTATGMVEIAKAVWDRVLTGATHNIANSAGRRLRQIEASFVVTAGTAQAGTVNTITLAAGESATDDIFAGDRVEIVGGTGQGEHGIITTYNGTTKVATMSQNWVITPDATSEYILSPADADVETWQHVAVSVSATTAKPEVDAFSVSDDATAAVKLAAHALETIPVTFSAGGSTTTAVLNQVDGAAASATNDVYNGRILVFNNSTLNHQIAEITDYDGATTTATISAVTTAPGAAHTARMV